MNFKKILLIKDISWASDLIFLLLAIGSYFLIFLGVHHLFLPDEGRYAEVAREMVANKNYLTPYLNGIVFLDKPILFYWLESLSFHWFGISEWSARLFPALIGVLGCLITYVAGRSLFNRRSGIIAALILGFSPLYYIFAHYVNVDLEVGVFISIALFSFIVAISDRQNSSKSAYLWIFYLSIGLAFLTKGLIGIVFPAMIIGSWIILLNQWSILGRIKLPLGFLIFLMVVCPWYILEQKAIPAFWHYFFVTQQFSRYLTQGFNCHQPFFFYVVAIVAGFFPWSIHLLQALYFHIRRVWSNRSQYSVELFLLLWVFLITLFFSIPKSKLAGYIIPALPPVALLLGVYWDHFWSEKRRKGFVLGVLIYSVIILLLPILFDVFVKDSDKLHVAGHHYFCFISGIWLFGVFWSWISLRGKTLLNLFMSLWVTSAIFLLVAVSIIPHLNLTSTKQQAFWLKQHINSKDKVVAFLDYYQDLPFYLGQKVFIVGDWEQMKNDDRDNWKHSFMVGRAFPTSSRSQLMNFKDFYSLWHSHQRVFAVVNSRKLSQFQSQIGTKGYLAQNTQPLVLTNQPIT